MVAAPGRERLISARTSLLSSGNESVWSGVLRSGGVRLLVLPVSAVLGIITTRIIIETGGTAAYAQYGLLVAIGSLLPFADLGVSAAIVNSIAASPDPRTDESLRRVLVTSIRVLCGSMVALLVVMLVISLTGSWTRIFGEALNPTSGPLVAALCLSMIAIAMPFGVGHRILAGLGKNYVSIALHGLQSPVVLLTIVLLLQMSPSATWGLAVIPYVVTFAIVIVATVIAGRLIAPSLSVARRDAAKVRTRPGGKVSDVAWPMLVLMIALPIAMQTDRILLSHVASTEALAEYNMGSQLYLPVWQVVSAAGLTLWPVFAKARAEGRRRSPFQMSLLFGAAAATVCVVISLVSPLLTQVASGGQVTLDLTLLLSFSALMTVQAVKYPLGMFLTDGPGMRYQAFMIVCMVPVNLALSLVLAAQLGAAGPVIGSVVGVLCFEVLANVLYIRRRLARAEAS